MPEERKLPLVILAGPTASGKTALSVELARRLNGEIISADSMQVYRGMDIGTAKVTPAERQGVAHHLIDICDPAVKSPEDEWNVSRFCTLASRKIVEICSRSHLPMLVGGTGFYIHALAYGAEFPEEPSDTGLREKLSRLSSRELHQKLLKADPESAAAIHENNRVRQIRALEFYLRTGIAMSQENARLHEKPSPYRLCFLVLDMPREQLYERIDRRVDHMMDSGLVEEVRKLQAAGCTKEMVSMQGLGYRQILSYLDGECTLQEAVYQIKLGSRHFAKRQMTWMRREKDAVFLPTDPASTLADRAQALIQRTFSEES